MKTFRALKYLSLGTELGQVGQPSPLYPSWQKVGLKSICRSDFSGNHLSSSPTVCVPVLSKLPVSPKSHRTAQAIDLGRKTFLPEHDGFDFFYHIINIFDCILIYTIVYNNWLYINIF